jgi:hypothetical protein
MHEADSMRTLEIPEKTFFLEWNEFHPSIFTTGVLNRRCCGCARSARSTRLICRFQTQDALNRQCFGCEKLATEISNTQPSRPDLPRRLAPVHTLLRRFLIA